MQLTFLGAAGEVTGSAYLLETTHARILIDFGMFQGARDDYRRNVVPPQVNAPRLDAVVITHAHIDHIGRLPLLPAAGFMGPIHITQASGELAALMLRDAGHIQETDTIRINRIRQARGQPPITPLYTEADVERVIPLFRPTSLGAEVTVAEGISARWLEAGHILGSASILLTVREGPRTVRIAFSGDLGPLGSPILSDFAPPTPPPAVDLVILESTYGDRDHRSLPETVEQFTQIIKEAVWAKEKMIIPVFAVGRTQALVYHLGALQRTGRVPKFPVFIDSPLAIEAMSIYRKHAELYDADARRIASKGHDPLDLDGLRFTRTSAESRTLNTLEGAAVIMAGSGMATGGRILHHLKHNLYRRDAQILIVGFQSRGSLGRQLVDGAKEVRIMGDTVPVRARIHTLNGFSAHAGRRDLLAWAGNFKPADQSAWPIFVLTHGEDGPRESLAAAVRSLTHADPLRPRFGDTIPL